MLGPNSITRTMQKEACANLQKAFASGDEKQITEAFDNFHNSIVEVVKQDYLEADGDAKVLAARGYRQLTREEKKFYEALVAAGKSDRPQQAFSDLIEVEGMPETIIEDVYKNLIDEHPLLAKISFTNVKYMTRLILNDHTVDKAVWGTVTAAISKKIDSSFQSLEMTQNKLTAYCLMDQAMLELGPTYIDNYVRTVLKDALACGLEGAIVSGNGLNCPVGLDRDIHHGVTFSTATGYPQKTAKALASLSPAAYGALLANLAVTEAWEDDDEVTHGGRMRKFDKVLFICNQLDYLTKIMPATTIMNAAGTYTKDIFPFPTEVVVSNEVATGKAIVCLPDEYFAGIGSSKEGNIEFSDEFKFLDDVRTFKIKLYGTGRAYDDTVAVLVDISEMAPTYITVQNMTPEDDPEPEPGPEPNGNGGNNGNEGNAGGNAGGEGSGVQG